MTAPHLEESADGWTIQGDGYRLRLPRRGAVGKLWIGERLLGKLSFAATTRRAGGVDVAWSEAEAQVARDGEVVTCTWTVRADGWQRVATHLVCARAYARAHVSIHGSGPVPRLSLLAGSGLAVDQVYNAQPNGNRQQVARAGTPSIASVSWNPDTPGGNWFFTPAPFVFAFGSRGVWLGVGIAADEGGWQLADVLAEPGAPTLTLVFGANERTQGSWQSPYVVLTPALDPAQAVQHHCDFLRSAQLAPTGPRGPRHGWWTEPIFCGWGEQWSLAIRDSGSAPDYARQELYERWLATLERNGVHPGTVVVDDRWQTHYGRAELDRGRWPDLEGFIERRHAAGQRVLMWWKAWDPDGVPADECMLDSQGNPVAVDPTNRAFRRRLERQVQWLLRDVGADGLKVDYTQSLPRDPAMRSVGGAWGVELQLAYVRLLSDAMRAARPEAMLVAHTAHPLFADQVDVLRLNDLPAWTYERDDQSVQPEMRHRAVVARAASPHWLLEADNWPCRSRAQWRDYVRAQGTGELGIPSLYYAEHLGFGERVERLTEEDYAVVREAWAQYRAAMRP